MVYIIGYTKGNYEHYTVEHLYMQQGHKAVFIT